MFTEKFTTGFRTLKQKGERIPPRPAVRGFQCAPRMNFAFLTSREDPEDVHPPSGLDRLLELESRLSDYRRLFWIVSALYLLSLGLVYRSAPRDPLVVGLFQDGQMQVLSPLSAEDQSGRFRIVLSAFIGEFLHDLTGYDSFQETYRLKKALDRMTPELRERFENDFARNQFVKRIRDSRVRSRIELRESQIRKVSPGIYSIVAVVVRHVASYDNPASRRDDILKCRFVVRTGAPLPSNPYGLWVSSYAEHLIDRTASPTGKTP